MEQYIKLLGKVCVTINGDWDKDIEYERLCIVRNPINKKSYISKMFVPKGNELTDDTYWQYLIGGVEDNLTSTDPEQALSANMGRVLNESLNQAIKDYNTKINSLTTKHNNDIKTLTEKHNNDIDTLNTAINDAVKDYTNKINTLTAKHNSDVSTLTAAISSLTNTVNANKAQHDIDIDTINTNINNLSKQHSEDIAELQTLVNNITSFEVEVVTSLPATGQKGIIYLVKSTGNTTDKAIYTEYIWIPSTSKYEILGEFETAVDLTNYQEKLISGSNIKTINGASILGSGNINTTPAVVTTSAAGLMSAADKTKLNGIQSGATAVSFSRAYSSGTKIGTITINGNAIDIYIPIWNGTLAQYNAIANKQSDMIYNITD